MSEDQLSPMVKDETLKANCGCSETEEKGGEPAPAAVQAPEGAEANQPVPVVNAEDKPVTMGELKALMVNTIPGMIEAAVGAQSSETKRAKLAAELKANSACHVPDATLDSLPLDALEGIGKTFVLSTDFSGNGGPREGDFQVNAENEVPDMQEIDWSKGR